VRARWKPGVARRPGRLGGGWAINVDASADVGRHLLYCSHRWPSCVCAICAGLGMTRGAGTDGRSEEKSGMLELARIHDSEAQQRRQVAEQQAPSAIAVRLRSARRPNPQNLLQRDAKASANESHLPRSTALHTCGTNFCAYAKPAGEGAERRRRLWRVRACGRHWVTHRCSRWGQPGERSGWRSAPRR
jgi:hypothetical protein